MDEPLDFLGYSDTGGFEGHSKLFLINEIFELKGISLNIRNVKKYSKYTRHRLMRTLKLLQS